MCGQERRGTEEALRTPATLPASVEPPATDLLCVAETGAPTAPPRPNPPPAIAPPDESPPPAPAPRPVPDAPMEEEGPKGAAAVPAMGAGARPASAVFSAAALCTPLTGGVAKACLALDARSRSGGGIERRSLWEEARSGSMHAALRCAAARAFAAAFSTASCAQRR